MESPKVEPKRVRAWAIARSLYAGSKVFYSNSRKNDRSSIEPFLFDDDRIGFGKYGPLVFKDSGLRNLVDFGFSCPDIYQLTKFPVLSLLKISHIVKISKYLKTVNYSNKYLQYLLLVGLEATACYLNYDRRFIEVKDHGCMQFMIDKNPTPLAKIEKSDDEIWKVSLGTDVITPNATLTFKTIKIGVDACLAKIDEKESISMGDLIVEGRLPLADTIGYASRIASSELSVFK